MPGKKPPPGERYDSPASRARRPPHAYVAARARHGKESGQRKEEKNSLISDVRAGEEKTAVDERGSDQEKYLLRLRQLGKGNAEVAPAHHIEEPPRHRKKEHREHRELH